MIPAWVVAKVQKAVGMKVLQRVGFGIKRTRMARSKEKVAKQYAV
jgi:hypothetical protein